MFSNYAEYYDLINQEKDYQKETEYVKSLINKFSQKTSSIFELGCGTGWHAIHFAKSGYKIFGIDQSAEMIKIANKNKNNQPNSISELITLKEGDIRNYKINRNFDLSLALFHVMSYQVKNNDLNQSIKTAANHLNSKGIFIFDCWYGPAVLSDKPYLRKKQMENDEIIIDRKATPKIFPRKNLVEIQFDIKVINKRDKKISKFQEIHKMRYLFEPEIEIFLNQNNFKLIHTEQWLSGAKPNLGSWYVTFVCERL